MQKSALILRKAKLADAGILASWWNDGKVMEHAGFPDGVHTTVEAVEKELMNQNDSFQRWIIEYEEKSIGEMCYRLEGKIADIGIKICPQSFQNQGLGTQALKMLIAYLFEEKQVEQIVLDTMKENQRAQHVYEKIGFKQTGIHENCWKDQRGKMRTAVSYSLTRKDLL